MRFLIVWVECSNRVRSITTWLIVKKKLKKKNYKIWGIYILFHYLNEDCMIFLINHIFFFYLNIVNFDSILLLFDLRNYLYIFVYIPFYYVMILICIDVYCTTLKINNLFFILKKRHVIYFIFHHTSIALCYITFLSAFFFVTVYSMTILNNT